MNQSKKKVQLEVGFPTSYANEVQDIVVEIAGLRRRSIGITTLKNTECTATARPRRPTGCCGKWNFRPNRRRKCTSATGWNRVKTAKHQYEQLTTYNILANYITENRSRFGPSAADYFAEICTCSSGYILHTGSDWKGTIGKAVVRVYSPALGAAALRVISPRKNCEVVRRDGISQLVWTFTDFEPEFDLDVEFVPDISVEKDLEILAGLIAENPADEKLREFQQLLSAFSGPCW